MASSSFPPATSRLPSAAAVALSLSVSLSACGPEPTVPEPVRAVKVVTAASGVRFEAQEFAADVRPRVETRLGFRVGGKILHRPAQLGQVVEAGQLLAQLDDQDLRLAAAAAQAQVDAATTQRELAAADLKRYADLHAQNFISGAELERREASLRSAQAQLEQAQAQLAVQANQAAHAALTAPAAGVVTGIEAEPGQVVGAGAPVLRLALHGERDAVFAIPEDRLHELRPGAPVAIRQWSDNRELQGRVRELSASADPVTRTYQVKVGIPGAGPPLGSSVYVRLAGAQAAAVPAIDLPLSALRHDAGGSAVWVLDGASMSVRLQPVQVQAIAGDRAVIASGLAPGMRVVVAGVHVLSPGQKVTVWQEGP